MNYSRTLGSRTKKDIHNNADDTFSVTVGAGNRSYVIEHLKKFTTYSVAIAGYNKQGVGPFSQHVYISTDEDGK